MLENSAYEFRLLLFFSTASLLDCNLVNRRAVCILLFDFNIFQKIASSPYYCDMGHHPGSKYYVFLSFLTHLSRIPNNCYYLVLGRKIIIKYKINMLSYRRSFEDFLFYLKST